MAWSVTGKWFIKSDGTFVKFLQRDRFLYIFSVLNFVLMLMSECNSYSGSLHNAVLLGCSSS